MVTHREKEFSKRLLRWSFSNRSSYPWRRTKDPYKILVTEMLLRKTSRKQVKELYDRFFHAYPDPKRLASASEAEIRKLVTPLGMEHRRASTLKELAKELVALRRIPMNKDGLMRLHGVGEYASNAVLCFAAGQDVPLVDTNVLRILQRVFSLHSSRRRPRTDSKVWVYAASLIPRGRAAEINLAMIDFAAAVCTANVPRCEECPLNDMCDYYSKRIGGGIPQALLSS